MDGLKTASGRRLKDSSFGLSRQGFLSLFALQFSPVVHSIALSLQTDDLGMMKEAVKDGAGSRGVTQHLSPSLP
jgi:hypothetical protein